MAVAKALNEGTQISNKANRLLTLRDVAKRLGLSEQRVYQMDADLQPVYVRRGSKMRTRMYRADIVERVRHERESEAIEPAYPTGLRQLWHAQLARWKRAGIEGDFSLDSFARLSIQQCHYCGAIPEVRQVGAHDARVNGLDVQNVKLGLKPGNVVTCCSRCESLRTVLEADALLEHAKRIVDWQAGQFMRMVLGLRTPSHAPK